MKDVFILCGVSKRFNWEFCCVEIKLNVPGFALKNSALIRENYLRVDSVAFNNPGVWVNFVGKTFL